MGVHGVKLGNVHQILVHTCKQGMWVMQPIALARAQQARVQCPPQSKPEPESGSIEPES